MGSFIVTTDSGCDLPLSFCSSRVIIPLKMNYAIGDKNYTDTMDPKDLKSFYDGMRAGDVPKTSQVTPYQFTEFWMPLLEKKQPIIHIALGSGISGTWANAVSAADMLMKENPGADIRIIDSTLASVGYGMLAILAADLRDCGSNADECQMQLEKVKSNINTYYTTGDLTYLYRSGRVSRTGMVIAHALNIWPILNLDLDGHLIVQAKERGKKKTIERIHRIISELCVDPEDQTLYICHSDIAEEAEQFGEDIKKEFGFRDVFYTYIGTTIGSNCGPGLMAAFFVGKKRTN